MPGTVRSPVSGNGTVGQGRGRRSRGSGPGSPFTVSTPPIVYRSHASSVRSSRVSGTSGPDQLSSVDRAVPQRVAERGRELRGGEHRDPVVRDRQRAGQRPRHVRAGA